MLCTCSMFCMRRSAKSMHGSIWPASVMPQVPPDLISDTNGAFALELMNYAQRRQGGAPGSFPLLDPSRWPASLPRQLFSLSYFTFLFVYHLFGRLANFPP